MDSNHRSRRQQIYSLPPLAAREATLVNADSALVRTSQAQSSRRSVASPLPQKSTLRFDFRGPLPADDRTRTDNLLITNQLLCQLSHIGLQINGTNRARTCDPLLVRQVLSQLSYDPISLSPIFQLATRRGLEPLTSAVTGRRSNQLNHRASSTLTLLLIGLRRVFSKRYHP